MMRRQKVDEDPFIEEEEEGQTMDGSSMMESMFQSNLTRSNISEGKMSITSKKNSVKFRLSSTKKIRGSVGQLRLKTFN